MSGEEDLDELVSVEDAIVVYRVLGDFVSDGEEVLDSFDEEGLDWTPEYEELEESVARARSVRGYLVQSFGSCVRDEE